MIFIILTNFPYKIVSLGYVLFFIYLFLFSWLLIKSGFISASGLPSKIVIFLFVLKVLSGCAYVWVMLKINTSLDTRGFHREGLVEYHLLFSHPGQYLTDIFYNRYNNGYAGLLSSTNSYWNDLSSFVIIKFLSVCDIFSFGNYYVNVIFYNYVTFFGAIGLYSVFNMIYVNKGRLLMITCFLLPSLLFFSSTIHKEGFIFAALGIVVFNISTALHKTGFTVVKFVYILLALSFIFVLRSYVLLGLLPALFAWVLSQSNKFSPVRVFIFTYIAVAAIFFCSGSIYPKLNLPESISKKQWDFEQLAPSSTHIPTKTLTPDFTGFAANMPQAFEHSLLRPWVADIHLSWFLLPLIIELILYQLLLVFFIFFRNKVRKRNPFILFSLFFSLSVLLIIGYTIPVIGAIVRYRSIYLPFILSPLICNINWNKVQKFKTNK